MQVANFFGPRSGGLRTALNALATGYGEAGHEVVQVVPGSQDAVHEMPWGRRVERRGYLLPGTGYRVLGAAAATRAVAAAAPDRLEVHDRTTLRGLGRWARRRGVPSLMVSHERLDRWLAQWLPSALPLGAAADKANTATALTYDAVVCTTGWAAQEFERLRIPNLVTVPLGVDLETFAPRTPDRALRADLARPDESLVVMVSRLSKEKCPDLAVAAVAELTTRGVAVRLAIAGDGPMRGALARQGAGLPVRLLGYVPQRDQVARLLASADVVLAPGPVETFGLAALEALACGTPVVASSHSALGEVLGPDGALGDGTPTGFADALQDVLARPEGDRRQSARRRAEQFPWSTTVAGFLDVHRLRAVERVA